MVPSRNRIATLPSGGVAMVSPWWTAAPGSSATSPAPTPRGPEFRSVDETAALIAAYAELGVARLAIDVPNPNLDVTLEQYALLAEAAAQVGALAP